jgi:hypothetical protein
MARFICLQCGEGYTGRRNPLTCPNCDRVGSVVAADERERDADDGLSGYSDPRDERAERRAR